MLSDTLIQDQAGDLLAHVIEKQDLDKPEVKELVFSGVTKRPSN